jgi:hypothetical protein
MRRVLIDECINPRLGRQLRQVLPQVLIDTVRDLGWTGYKDDVLVSEIQDRFDVFLTIDKGFEFEHNFRSLSFGVVVIETANNQMYSYERVLDELVAAVQSVLPGQPARVTDRKR